MGTFMGAILGRILGRLERDLGLQIEYIERWGIPKAMRTVSA